MLSKANYDLLSEYRSSVLPFTEDNAERIEALVSDKLLSVEQRNSRFVDKGSLFYVDYDPFLRITPEGEDALASYEEMLHDKAQAKHDKAKDRRLQIILALLSFASGLVIEHLIGIVSFVAEIF